MEIFIEVERLLAMLMFNYHHFFISLILQLLVLDNKTLVDHMPSLYAALREEKSKAPVTSSLAHSSDSSVECELLNNTSSSFISDIPSLHKGKS